MRSPKSTLNTDKYKIRDSDTKLAYAITCGGEL